MNKPPRCTRSARAQLQTGMSTYWMQNGLATQIPFDCQMLPCPSLNDCYRTKCTIKWRSTHFFPHHIVICPHLHCVPHVTQHGNVITGVGPQLPSIVHHDGHGHVVAGRKRSGQFLQLLHQGDNPGSHRVPKGTDDGKISLGYADLEQTQAGCFPVGSLHLQTKLVALNNRKYCWITTQDLQVTIVRQPPCPTASKAHPGLAVLPGSD